MDLLTSMKGVFSQFNGRTG